MKKTGIILVVLLGLFSLYGVQKPATAHAEESWKQEFDDICAATENPMVLTAEELKILVERCDALKLKIEKLAETPQKVYLKRLKMCRDLLAFALESKLQTKP